MIHSLADFFIGRQYAPMSREWGTIIGYHPIGSTPFLDREVFDAINSSVEAL